MLSSNSRIHLRIKLFPGSITASDGTTVSLGTSSQSFGENELPARSSVQLAVTTTAFA
jgi:hypothetical protein